jgi:hypothetical protein
VIWKQTIKPFRQVRIFGFDVTELLDSNDMHQQAPMTPEQYTALEPDKVLLTMRIIAVALIASVVTFGGIASFIVFGQPQAAQPVGQPPAQNGAEIVMYLAMAFAAVAVVMSFVVPNLIAAAGVKGVAKMAQDGTATGPKELFGRLLAVAQIKMIIALALVEGAAFFNLIAFIITKSLIPPAVVGALLLVMAIHFPTKFKLALWLEDQQRLLS